MSLFEQQRVAPFGAESVYKATEVFENVIQMIKAKLVADRTYRELSKLSAHQLADIGLGETDLVEFSRSASNRVR
mgnify:CR=1 FL=1